MGDDALPVALYGELIGDLLPRAQGAVFQARRDALEHYGVGSTVLSLNLPLDREPASVGATAAFFGGLLPEGARLTELISSVPGLRRDDLVGLLRVAGADVTGALVLPGPEVTELGPLLTHAEVAAEVATPSRYIAGGGSTASGVQPKVALGRSAAGWHAARDGHPSTHLIKPVPVEARRGAVAEVWVMRLAKAVGLIDYEVWLEDFGGIPAVVVERFDREVVATTVTRLHQEDAAQAIGLAWGGDDKFEWAGSGASLAVIAALLDRGRSIFHAGPSDREALLRQLTFRVLVGDTDGHAKNHALLHDTDGGVRLAPLYDVTPQVLYAGGAVLALFVARRRQLLDVGTEELVTEAAGWGVEPARAREVVAEVAERVRDEARTLAAPLEIAAHLPGYVTRAAASVLGGGVAGLGLGEFPTLEPIPVV